MFVTGLERGLVPISHAQGDAEALDEEHRLLYVALSRAERALHVSWAQRARPRRTEASSRTASPYLVEFERAVSGKEPEETGRAANQRGARAATERLAAAADAELTPDDRRVFDALVAWRLDVVARRGRPRVRGLRQQGAPLGRPRARPTSDHELLAVAGIGPTKLERYGAAVLEIVGRHTASSTG